MSSSDILTAPQTAMFWRNFSAACRALGLSGRAAQEEYRKRILREECGVASLKLVTRCAALDKLMMRLAIDAEDYALAARFEAGGERRLARLVESCATQVMQLSGRADSDALDYVLAIVRQAGYTIVQRDGLYWLDLGDGEIARLFMMLDTHRRRLLAAASWGGSMAFRVDVSWRVLAGGRVMLVEAAEVPPAIRVA